MFPAAWDVAGVHKNESTALAEIAVAAVAVAVGEPIGPPATVAAMRLKRAFESMATHWELMATKEDTLHRMLCIVLGDVTIIAGVALYIKLTDNAYSRDMHDAIREVVLQQATLFKVCVFIFIEVR